jgi:hypothetical protein
MIVAADVEHLVARAAILRMTNTCSPVSHLIEVGQFLRVQVQEIARSPVLIAVRRFLILERGSLGDPSLPEPETHGGAGDAQRGGNLDRRLALPSSPYGLDDKAKLVAPRQAVQATGAVLQPGASFNPKSMNPLVSGPSRKPAMADAWMTDIPESTL